MPESPPLDPEDILRRFMEAGREIKFGAGVVGKTSRAMLGLLAIWGLVLARLGPNVVLDGALLGGGLVISALVFWWVKSTQAFAERNPAQAIMDGAQFLE